MPESAAVIHESMERCLRTEERTRMEEWVRRYQGDERKSVRAMVTRMARAIDDYDREEERIRKLRSFEDNYQGDYHAICGIDEVGRGPLAGPVTTCAVILPEGCTLHGINDSKKLTPKKREELDRKIREIAVSVSISFNSPERIDEINILNATLESMRRSVLGLDPPADLVLVDAVHIPDLTVPEVSIIKGDAKSISIGAASIVAKVARDRYMIEMDRKYPEYHFRENKGYGTADHIAALKKYGPCPIHRKSFIGHFV